MLGSAGGDGGITGSSLIVLEEGQKSNAEMAGWVVCVHQCQWYVATCATKRGGPGAAYR
ncbi:hypothetical protein BH10PLA2_BH10PLA2_31240 [soil metagenome]